MNIYSTDLHEWFQESLPYEEQLDRLGIWKNEGIVQIYYRYSTSFTRDGHLLRLVTSSRPVLLRTLEAILQRLINRDVILTYDDPFLLPCHRQVERFIRKHHTCRLWYNQYFQERAQQVEEESDGLLHEPAGPPGPMASSALKDSDEQVRPRLVSHLVRLLLL